MQATSVNENTSADSIMEGILKDPEFRKDQDVKKDSGKLMLELVPPEAEEAIARALHYGATSGKYKTFSWEQGMDHGRIIGAIKRHMNAYLKGEYIDEESKLHPLDHAICDLAMLITYIQRGIGEEMKGISLRRTQYEQKEGRTCIS